MKKTDKQTKVSKHSRKPIFATVALLIILIPAVYFYSASLSQPTEAKAAIIDQLGSSRLDDAIRYENQTFIESAKELLYKRFSIVDYYSDNATVEEYSKLASQSYKLILWRAHSALDLNLKYIAMSTTEKNDSASYKQYYNLYSEGKLTLVNITGDPTLYWGITSTFIDQVMTGTFQDTVIVLMSCNGLQPGYLKTAQALEAKGAKVIISWDNWVTTADNDYVASLLLQHLIEDNNTVSVAVGKLSSFQSELGGILQYDPHNVGDYRIPDYRKNDNTNSALMIFPVSEKVKDPRSKRF